MRRRKVVVESGAGAGIGFDDPAYEAAGADCAVQGPEAHGIPCFVNLYGIETPGLTASSPLADAALTRR